MWHPKKIVWHATQTLTAKNSSISHVIRKNSLESWAFNDAKNLIIFVVWTFELRLLKNSNTAKNKHLLQYWWKPCEMSLKLYPITRHTYIWTMGPTSNLWKLCLYNKFGYHLDEISWPLTFQISIWENLWVNNGNSRGRDPLDRYQESQNLYTLQLWNCDPYISSL